MRIIIIYCDREGWGKEEGKGDSIMRLSDHGLEWQNTAQSLANTGFVELIELCK